MKALPLLSVVVAVLALGAMGPNDLVARVAALEARVVALEKSLSLPSGEQPEKNAAAVVSVRLANKEARRENPMLDYYNLVFDVEFVGTPLLGDRRIRDIKGTLFFDDAFGDQIIGAKTTQRLGIGAGESRTINGMLIEYTTVEFSDGWKRVLATDSDELHLRFVVDRVIYED